MNDYDGLNDIPETDDLSDLIEVSNDIKDLNLSFNFNKIFAGPQCPPMGPEITDYRDIRGV